MVWPTTRHLILGPVAPNALSIERIVKLEMNVSMRRRERKDITKHYCHEVNEK